jgi:hypothetical protein
MNPLKWSNPVKKRPDSKHPRPGRQVGLRRPRAEISIARQGRMSGDVARCGHGVYIHETSCDERATSFAKRHWRVQFCTRYYHSRGVVYIKKRNWTHVIGIYDEAIDVDPIVAVAFKPEAMFIATTGTLQSPNRANADFQKCRRTQSN